MGNPFKTYIERPYSPFLYFGTWHHVYGVDLPLLGRGNPGYKENGDVAHFTTGMSNSSTVFLTTMINWNRKCCEHC